MAAEQHSSADKWILAMVRAAGRFGLPCDIPALRQQMRWFENLPLQRRLERIGALLGLQITIRPKNSVSWRNEVMPVM
ncbi:MAG: type I secretion system permease/ATPase, partial [Enterobacterales bacterium]|nr:type I secretion system permease/ATPase [Enterobacterales bacterium]